MKSFKGRAVHINPVNKFESTNRSSLINLDLYEKDALPIKTKIIESKAKSIINKVTSPDIPMNYSMNPYQGCEHGCVYCYARTTHNYWGYSAGLDFETNIIVKVNATGLLRKRLRSRNWKASPVMLSGNTDCYQPIEKKYKITRNVLQVFQDYRHPVGIITKNKLILRDLDIIKALSKDRLVSVVVSINTLDDKLRQKLEPRASTVQNRIELIEQLLQEDIPVSVLAAPIIPGLNDHSIFDLVKKLSELGVYDIGHVLIRLNGDIREIFDHWLERHYPDRAEKIINKIKSLHGGEVSDHRFVTRMKGEGKIAGIIHQQFTLAKQKYLRKKEFEFNLDIYDSYKNPQLSLF